MLYKVRASTVIPHNDHHASLCSMSAFCSTLGYGQDALLEALWWCGSKSLLNRSVDTAPTSKWSFMTRRHSLLLLYLLVVSLRNDFGCFLQFISSGLNGCELELRCTYDYMLCQLHFLGSDFEEDDIRLHVDSKLSCMALSMYRLLQSLMCMDIRSFYIQDPHIHVSCIAYPTITYKNAYGVVPKLQ